jgi:hypothetical protein
LNIEELTLATDDFKRYRAMRAFVGIDVGREPVLDETTATLFRHMLEKQELGAGIFQAEGANSAGRAQAEFPAHLPRTPRNRLPPGQDGDADRHDVRDRRGPQDRVDAQRAAQGCPWCDGAVALQRRRGGGAGTPGQPAVGVTPSHWQTPPMPIDPNPDEAFAFAMMAAALIRRLDLRHDAREAAFTELWRERRIMRAWLEREGRPGRSEAVSPSRRSADWLNRLGSSPFG